MPKKTTDPQTVTCLKQNLAKALTISGKAVAARSTLPILGHVLLKADAARLHLTGTNLEIALTARAGAKLEGEPFSITLPAKTFTDVVHTLPDDETVTLDYIPKTQTVSIRSGSFNTNLKGLAPDEFPLVPDLGDEGFTLASADLRAAIERVVFAAATDEGRPLLTGILFHSDPKANTLTLAAADGFRLAVVKLPAPGLPAFTAIVPAHAFDHTILNPLLAGDELTHLVLLGPNGTPDRLGFRCGPIEMIANLIEGIFPDYQNVIPKRQALTVTADVAALQRASKAADVIARDNGRTLRLALVPQQATDSGVIPSGLELKATSSETGDHFSFVHADYEGAPLELGLNNKFLLDALNAIGDERVILEFKDTTSPILLRPAVGDDYLSLIMPMHVGK